MSTLAHTEVAAVAGSTNSTTTEPLAELNITFEYGKVRTFDALASNTIALDGAVQGPAADPATRRYSFDHHGGCLRLVTLATCQQVAVALSLGLVVDRNTNVVINDIDADTVVSVWLLRDALRGGNAGRLKMIKDLVERVGLTDAHGPVFAPHPLHAALGPKWGDKAPQDMAMLATFLEKLDAWYAGAEDEPREERAGVGYGLKATGGWVPVKTPDGFGPLYAEGYLAAALVTPANDKSFTWVIGKRSDLVPLAVGPADSSKDRSGQYLPTILGTIAQAEHALGVAHSDNWGGGSSIGGSPRLPGGVGSRLSEEAVLAILNRFTIG